jgi:penicillin amidase
LAVAVRLFEAWNGQMDAQKAAPVLAALLFDQMQKAIAAKAVPGREDQFRQHVGPAEVERLLRERPPGWFDSYDRVLLDSLRAAMEEGKKLQGSDLTRWRWGRTHVLFLRQFVMGDLPWAGGWFRLGPEEMNGSSTTVQQLSSRVAPSMRFVADLADWDRSLLTLPSGQTGVIFGGHYSDQWETWTRGGATPMAFDRVPVNSTLTLKPLN